jgi:hypothetical protein
MADIDLNVTAAEIDAAVQAYTNSSIEGTRSTIDTSGFYDNTTITSQKVAESLDALHESVDTAAATGRLVNRFVVGASGKYTTLKDAVDAFNASATADTEILLDAGNHTIADTITVNNATYNLQVRGLGSAVTILQAATGLTSKPMFIVKSKCDINKVTLDGSTLASYGTLSTENGVDFNTTNGVYSEITDIVFKNFNIGLYDTIGTSIFTFNATYNDITTAAIRFNTSNGNAYLDCEVVSFSNCAIGIDFLKANTGGFYVNTCFFVNQSGQIGIKYTGGVGSYVYAGICNISDCTYNNVGTFLSGFTFNGTESPVGRDANIVIINNPGAENKNPHCKINVLNNASTTTITTGSTFYKAVFNNTSSYTTKWTISSNKVLYQPTNTRDAMMWVSCNVINSQNNRNVDIAVIKNGNVALGVFGQMTVRCTVSGVSYPVTTNVYLSDVTAGDYFEIWVTSSNNGDLVTVQDVAWLTDSK